MNLAEIKKDTNCRVISVEGGHGVAKKLSDLGLREGARISKISSQFMKGPVTVRVGCTEIAVGYGIAKKIMVECIKK